MEITVYDSDGTPTQRVHGHVERPRIEYRDLSRFGWDGDTDEFTIGELATRLKAGRF